MADQNMPQQVRIRLGKRKRLLESGAEPYPAGFERIANIRETLLFPFVRPD